MHPLTATATRVRTRAWSLALRARADLRTRFDAMLAEPESGMDDIPWKMILMIGGGVIAVGIVAAIVTFVHAQLALLPTNPGF